MKPKRIDILGVPLDCVTMESAVDYADSIIREKRSGAILAVNPEKVIHCLDNGAFLEMIKAADLLIPDGIGVVLAAKMRGETSIERVPGSELMPNLCKLAAQKGYSVFLFGAKPEVNDMTVRTLGARYPGLRIVGHQHGYLEAGDMDDLADRISSLSPDLLFVALGSPRQEQWIMEYLPRMDVRVCQGVGGTFDVICGNVRRAPRMFRSLHLEWFYRLVTNPRRLVRQTALPRFVWKLMVSRKPESEL